MQLVALAESENHVCARYRLAAFRPALEAVGHSLTIQALPSSWFARLTLGRDLAAADAVIVQRKLLPRVALTLLRRRVKKLLFDFDDAVWLRDSYAAKGFESPKRTHRFRRIIEACDLVLAGNGYLAEAARRYTTSERVIVVPTCIDMVKYPHSERPARAGLQLVWVGSSSTLRGLEQFTPTLSAIGRAVPGTRLKLICDRFIDIPDMPVDRCPWNDATEAAEITSADIGIGWVPDDPWSRGKCGLKVLQYQAAGLPVIANPVGVQAAFVREGVTGFQASTTEQWVNAVRQLTEASLRQRLGRNGREQVKQAYSTTAGSQLWLAALPRLNEPTRRAG